MKFLHPLGMRRSKILLLGRILTQVEELEFLGSGRVEVFNQFPVSLANRSTRDSSQKMISVQGVVPMQRIPFRWFGRVAPGSECRYAIQFLVWVRLDTGGFKKGRVEVMIDDGFRAYLSCGYFSLRPPDDEGNPDAAFVKLALPSAKRSVGGNVGFSAIVT